LQYYIGCSGWSYTSGEGLFYPSGTDNLSSGLHNNKNRTADLWVFFVRRHRHRIQEGKSYG